MWARPLAGRREELWDLGIPRLSAPGIFGSAYSQDVHAPEAELELSHGIPYIRGLACLTQSNLGRVRMNKGDGFERERWKIVRK